MTGAKLRLVRPANQAVGMSSIVRRQNRCADRDAAWPLAILDFSIHQHLAVGDPLLGLAPEPHRPVAFSSWSSWMNSPSTEKRMVMVAGSDVPWECFRSGGLCQSRPNPPIR
jgi:hypothetical protein